MKTFTYENACIKYLNQIYSPGLLPEFISFGESNCYTMLYSNVIKSYILLITYQKFRCIGILNKKFKSRLAFVKT